MVLVSLFRFELSTNKSIFLYPFKQKHDCDMKMLEVEAPVHFLRCLVERKYFCKPIGGDIQIQTKCRGRFADGQS